MPKKILPILCEKALDNTLQIFWERGYFNTSIEDIIEASGFNRAAIYKYFGGKHGIFIAMLERYQKKITDPFTASLRNKNIGIEGIQVFFEHFIQFNEPSDFPYGCFLIATASDLPSHDDEIVVIIKKFIDKLHILFYNILSTAQNQGLLRSKIDCNSVSHFLVGNLFGIMTLYRTQVPKKIIKSHVKHIVNFLSSIKCITHI